MRAGEFLMKDAYSFDIDAAGMQRAYEAMHAAYMRIFTRLGLRFRAVQADSGAIGGDASQEFHVLADSGEDAIAFSIGSDYAANIETAQAALPGPRPAAGEDLRKIDTPTQKTCEDVAALMGIDLSRTAKSIALVGADGDGNDQFVLALVRGDHAANEIKLAKVEGLADYRMATQVERPRRKTCEAAAARMGIDLSRTATSTAVVGADGDGNDQCVLELVRADHDANEIKLAKVEGLADYRMATEAEILAHLGSEPGFLGPVAPRQPIRVLADREVAAMADFVVGANEPGFHLAGVNWGRDLPEPDTVADIRSVVEGDRAADGGELRIVRGIEVGHVFQLGSKYAEAMGCTVLDEQGKPRVLQMGCYGIGISRIVAAAIEQNFDASGILWPDAMAPWRVAVCVINPKRDDTVAAAAEALYRELSDAGIETVLDDRGLRPGQMFADIELIGIPHRVVVSGRGLEAGTFEYRARAAEESENLDRGTLLARLQ